MLVLEISTLVATIMSFWVSALAYAEHDTAVAVIFAVLGVVFMFAYIFTRTLSKIDEDDDYNSLLKEIDRLLDKIKELKK